MRCSGGCRHVLRDSHLKNDLKAHQHDLTSTSSGDCGENVCLRDGKTASYT